jgi:hypothetical protein
VSKIKDKKLSEAKRPAVVQRHPMGCAVACVAFCLGLTYDETLKFFRVKSNAWLNGFYCPEITKILNASGSSVYKWRKVKGNQSSKSLADMSIIFCKPSKFYPHGHFFVKKADKEFMNPWINFPDILPGKAGFQETLPSKISYVIEPST